MPVIYDKRIAVSIAGSDLTVGFKGSPTSQTYPLSSLLDLAANEAEQDEMIGKLALARALQQGVPLASLDQMDNKRCLIEPDAVNGDVVRITD